MLNIFSVIELTTSKSKHEIVALMSNAIQNGKLSLREKSELATKPQDIDVPTEEVPQESREFATPASHQFIVLLQRSLLQASRNKVSLLSETIYARMVYYNFFILLRVPQTNL
jgi:hypothetical protein